MQQPQDIPVAPVPTHANGWLWLPLVLAIGAAAAAMTLESDTPPPLAAWLTLPFILLVGGVLAMAMRRRARSGCSRAMMPSPMWRSSSRLVWLR